MRLDNILKCKHVSYTRCYDNGRYHACQHIRISGNACLFNPEGTVPFTLAIGSIGIDLDRTKLMAPSGLIWFDSGRVYTACGIEPIWSGSIQKSSVNRLYVTYPSSVEIVLAHSYSNTREPTVYTLAWATSVLWCRSHNHESGRKIICASSCCKIGVIQTVQHHPHHILLVVWLKTRYIGLAWPSRSCTVNCPPVPSTSFSFPTPSPPGCW